MQKILKKINSISSINKSSKIDVAFVGLTHLGLVASISTASLKKKVLAVDESIKLIRDLNRGTIELSEPGLLDILQKSGKYYFPVSNFSLLSTSSLVIISLDTPTDRPSDLKILDSLIDRIIPNLRDNSTLVLMSQVSVGFSRKLNERIKKQRPGLNFNLYYLLNTLIIGDSVKRFLHPERIIVGLEFPNKSITQEFQSFLNSFNAPILTMIYESAELTKSAINLFLASSIITTNTLADFCEATGADINDIIPALKSDKRIGPFAYLKPTLRISGGHLERELVKLSELADQYRIPSGIVEPLKKLNDSRINWLTNKISRLSRTQTIKIITLWGLAYKKDTESTDNAASIEIIKKLSKKFSFQVYDPQAVLPKGIPAVKRFKDKYSALNKTDLLVVLTEWDEFREIDKEQFADNLVVIDCVGVIDNTIPGIKLVRIGKS